MTGLEEGLERKKIIYFSLSEHVGILKGELKIKGLINGKSVVPLQLLT